MSQLADKVAAAVSPTSVTLTVENMSSLDASYAAVVEAALRTQLLRHSFSIAPESPASAQSAVSLHLTLSESAAEYVWVLQTLGSTNDVSAIPLMIVPVPKADVANADAGGQALSLEKRFVWKQPERFLDFAILKSKSSDQPALLVLEVNRLAAYTQAGSEWLPNHSTSIPQPAAQSRDPHGTIHLKNGTISVKGFECVGEPDIAGNVNCIAAVPTRALSGARVHISGLPNSVGAATSGRCSGETISLYSGEGDWTQPDTLRGYLLNLGLLFAVASGGAIEFDGPVIALQPEPDTSSARAIVHNLKTGNYEAYIVTATCGN